MILFYIKIAALFVASVIVRKIINDSLPKIGVKELRGYAYRVGMYLVMLGLFCALWIKYLILSNKQQPTPREQQLIFAILCLMVIGAFAIFMLRKIEEDKNNKLNSPMA